MDDDILRRVPPQNLEAEQSVLGAVLLDNKALDDALEHLVPEDFYRETHRDVFRAMVSLFNRNSPIDAITLVDELRTRGSLIAVGGPAYIAELASIVPTALNTPTYARIVRDRSIKRAIASTAVEIASDAYDSTAPDAAEMLDMAEHRIFAIAERGMRKQLRSMPELTRTSLRTLEELYEDKNLITGVPTGFDDLDKLTAGLQRSDLIIIAARPGMGKTAFALNIAVNAALADPPTGVIFFSVETSDERLVLRMLCSEAGVDWARARTGYLRKDDFPKLAAAASALSAAPIFIDDSSDTSPLTMRAVCRRLAREPGFNLGMVVVDYLQLMASSERSESREREIANITRALKKLAKELRVPVVALSQLNRQVESRPERRPLLADLRESGAIEQDADVIAFIYREDYYKGKEATEPGTAEIIVAKQRDGPTDTVKLTYIREFTRFANYKRPERDT